MIISLIFSILICYWISLQMKGWFDAFRDDGGPTLYAFSNRTPVTGDVSIVAVCIFFGTLYLAFLVIFPGVRKQVRPEFLIYRIIILSTNKTIFLFVTING